MRWITFTILLYVMAALQAAGLGGWPHGQGIWPRIEYIPILAIFYALYAAEPSAPLCGLICGICYDICTPDDLLGTNAVAMAIMALLVLRVRLSIFREHFGSQVLITFLAVLIFGFFSVLCRKIIGAPLDHDSMWYDFGEMAANAVYTAAVAPIFFWIFFRFYPLLGFSTHGSRGRAHDGRR